MPWVSMVSVLKKLKVVPRAKKSPTIMTSTLAPGCAPDGLSEVKLGWLPMIEKQFWQYPVEPVGPVTCTDHEPGAARSSVKDARIEDTVLSTGSTEPTMEG